MLLERDGARLQHLTEEAVKSTTASDPPVRHVHTHVPRSESDIHDLRMMTCASIRILWELRYVCT
jgi:hypothetical protein